ncbi:glycosyltransferase [Streptomyces morookaense]|uniref:Glycosyltransferase n=1 Tax=Streptomyces morookaense TaxID=1970 RepID=A0A7Y7B7M7_STRMO|nr:nucleotide disphospho-sugar-binding domain-containing protein [Streptomyces morookaense]NVK80518.1 glycosyltransferase [Streptomyces morookaense]GHF46930.1 glycosyl transferase [Streptomyces morookaense]
MPRIIVAATPPHGHTAPLRVIAADLVDRGHEVAFLGGSRFAEEVAATGARFVPLPDEADFDDRTVDDCFPGRALVPPGPERLAFDLKHIFLDPVPAQYRALRELLTEVPADAVISDNFFRGTLALTLARPAAERPVTVSVGVAPPTMLSIDTAPFGLALPPRSDEAGRSRNAALNAEAAARAEPLRRYAADVFARIGTPLPDGPIGNVTVAVPDHYLQLTVPGFEYPRSDAPDSFRCIGALPVAGAPAGYEAPSWWPELTQDGRPVVVVTQGTLDNADLSALVAPAVRALADAEVLVVAATVRPDGPRVLEGLLGGLPDNVRAAGYVPFELLLPHADVLVSNSGYGGVHTALRHGVPLVVAGAGEDKPEVAARVQWSGTGIDLRTGRPGTADLRAAVDTVLTDSTYRARASALSSELAAHRPFDAIAELVDGPRAFTSGEGAS